MNLFSFYIFFVFKVLFDKLMMYGFGLMIFGNVFGSNFVGSGGMLFMIFGFFVNNGLLVLMFLVGLLINDRGILSGLFNVNFGMLLFFGFLLMKGGLNWFFFNMVMFLM